MKKFTNRNTKAEILSAYNALVKDYKALKSQKSAPAKAAPRAAAPASADDGEMTIASIIEKLSSLTVSIGESASALQGDLTGEATQLQNMRQEAETLTARLETIHNIEVHEDTLDELVQKYQETAEATEQELDEKSKSFKDEISEKRSSWKKEQEEHNQTIKERNAALKKARQREVQEYKYDQDQTKKHEQDESGQMQKAFDRELANLREVKEAEWTEREKALVAREKEARELEEKAAAFPKELEDKVKRAEQEGANIARRDTRSTSELQKKDHESERRVLDLKVQSLEQTLAKHEQLIEALSAQLDNARQQTTELAVKAIEGASNASSFESIKEIALEQAKNTKPGK